jgi:hypothetical protein
VGGTDRDCVDHGSTLLVMARWWTAAVNGQVAVPAGGQLEVPNLAVVQLFLGFLFVLGLGSCALRLR